MQGQLHIAGFTFGHLGGFAGDTEPEMRARGMDSWDNWASRDKYSPAPYAQLAAALTNAGDRDAANEIRYLGRVRERETESGLPYVWSGALQYVAGFGIGRYTFRVLWWVLGFSLAGMALLLWTVSAKEKAEWLNRLLYGDNLLVMQALLAGDPATSLPSMRGMIDLIYIDPPFDSKADYRTKITLPGKELEQKPMPTHGKTAQPAISA